MLGAQPRRARRRSSVKATAVHKLDHVPRTRSWRHIEQLRTSSSRAAWTLEFDAVDSLSSKPIALFDLDNTILDRERAFGRWMEHFIAAHDSSDEASISIERIDEDGFLPREQFFGQLRNEFGIIDSIDALLADYAVECPSNYVAEPEVIDAV